MRPYEICILVGVPTIIAFIVQTVFSLIASFAKKRTSTELVLRLGVQALLRDRLIQAYRYFMTKGSIGISDRENFNNMYQQYHSLGKNGVMDEIYKEVMNLPTEINEIKKSS